MSPRKYSYPFVKSKKGDRRSKKSTSESSSFSYPFITRKDGIKQSNDKGELIIPSTKAERNLLSLLKSDIALAFEDIQRELSVTATELQRYLHQLGRYVIRDKHDLFRLTAEGLLVEDKISKSKDQKM
jgi:hypothetical protein